MTPASAAAPRSRLDFVVQPGGNLQGELRAPGDKSISHRALLLGGIASGVTSISNFLESEDCLATLRILRVLGVAVNHLRNGEIQVHGVGRDGLHAPTRTLECGNSGTSMRLLSGLLAGQSFVSTLDGDDSLRRRPMQRVIEPLTQMGARFESSGGHAPLTVCGRQPLKPLHHELPVASAQVKSAILLAGLHANGETWIREPAISRDHTERMLQAFNCKVLRAEDWIGVHGGSELQAVDIAVPNDLSAAAFFLVGAAISPGTTFTIKGIGINPTRDGVLRLLRRMGSEIHLKNERFLGVEPVADIEVRGRDLRGIEITPADVPLAIDELPALLVAAAAAHGQTTLYGAAELRIKESDRLAAMADGLRRLGVPVELFEDGMRVTGVDNFQGGEINSFGDHRIAMSFAMAAMHSTEPIRIRDCRNVDTSFPAFAETARSAGLSIHVEEVA